MKRPAGAATAMESSSAQISSCMIRRLLVHFLDTECRYRKTWLGLQVSPRRTDGQINSFQTVSHIMINESCVHRQSSREVYEDEDEELPVGQHRSVLEHLAVASNNETLFILRQYSIVAMDMWANDGDGEETKDLCRAKDLEANQKLEPEHRFLGPPGTHALVGFACDRPRIGATRHKRSSRSLAARIRHAWERRWNLYLAGNHSSCISMPSPG